jgi:hypothetical protein
MNYSILSNLYLRVQSDLSLNGPGRLLQKLESVVINSITSKEMYSVMGREFRHCFCIVYGKLNYVQET